MPLTRPSVTPPWASTAGDNVQPTDVEIQAGWPLSNTPPARQRWNWLLNWLMNGVRYLARRGLADYAAGETYMTGDRCIGDDGKTYRSVVDNNTGHTPSTDDGSHWERWGYSAAEIADVINGKKATFIVRVASTAAVNLAAPGAAIDGVAMVAGDLFLEKDNGTGALRGIYVWNGAAVPATRSPDADAGTELKAGVIISVTEGTANADTLWELTTDGAITIGVTALTFAQTNSGVYLKKAGDTATGAINGVTAAPGDNTTKFSTTAFVTAAIAAIFSAINNWSKGQSGTVAALPATTGTLTFDFTAGSNFSGQVTGACTFGNGYTTHGAGKATWFSIRVQQDAATLRNWAFGTNWKYVGGSGAIPAQTQTLNAWDTIVGQVLTDGTIEFAVRSDVK